MKLAAPHEIFLAFSFVIIQIAVKSVESNLPYQNKNFVKIKQDLTRFQQASAYRNKNINYAPIFYSNTTTSSENNKIDSYVTLRQAGNYSQDKYKIGYNHEKAFPKTGQIKKWQVGRVSRKQYEIINMLWRKTKIFGDVESTTANYLYRHHNDTIRRIRQTFMQFSSLPALSSTTPSFIEFYYLDDADERVKELPTQKHTPALSMKEYLIKYHGNHKFVRSDSPMFSFRIHDASYKPPAFTTRYTEVTNKNKRRRARTRDSSHTGFNSHSPLTPSYQLSRIHTQPHKFVKKSTASRNVILNTTSTISTTENTYDNETCPTTEDYIVNDRTKIENTTSDIVTATQKLKSTTVYDKIKFFEMYDKSTPISYYDEKGRYDMDNVDVFIKGNDLERQVLLEHVDQSIGNYHSQTHKAKPAKKHIIDSYKKESKNQSYANSLVGSKTTVTLIKQNAPNVSQHPALIPNVSEQNVTKKPIIKLLQSESNASPLLEHGKSQNVEWSQYSFAAAYVYEPLRVFLILIVFHLKDTEE